MKFITTLFVSIILLISTANATSYIGDVTSCPAKQVQQMIDDFKAGDIEKAQKYIVKPSDEKKRKKVNEMNRKLSDRFVSGRMKYKVIDSKVSGNWAVVAVGVTNNLDNNGEQIKSGWLRNETLYKNGDQWMIIHQAIRSRDPKVDGWKNEDHKVVMDWWNYEIRKKISQHHPQRAKAMEQLRKQQAKQKTKKN